MTQFVRWAAGAHPGPNGPPASADVWLYQKALICKTFPAYKLEDLNRQTKIVEIMQAMQLLNAAQQAQG